MYNLVSLQVFAFIKRFTICFVGNTTYPPRAKAKEMQALASGQSEVTCTDTSLQSMQLILLVNQSMSTNRKRCMLSFRLAGTRQRQATEIYSRDITNAVIDEINQRPGTFVMESNTIFCVHLYKCASQLFCCMQNVEVI